MSFRRATEADIPQIMAVRASVKENELSDPSALPPDMVAEYLAEHGPGWVCEKEDRILGFAMVDRRDNSIFGLFVRPDAEAGGIGSRLLALATDWLFDQGADRIVLSTDPGTRADAFYQRQGWNRGELKSNGEVVFRLPRPQG